MEKQGINLFIVDDNKLVVTTLKQYLQTKFGDSLQISTFSDGESCLEKIDKQTRIVILDYFMEDKNGIEVLKLIKATNPKTEVIILSSNENIEAAIKLFRAGAKDYVVKGDGSWDKIIEVVADIIAKPRVTVKGFLK